MEQSNWVKRQKSRSIFLLPEFTSRQFVMLELLNASSYLPNEAGWVPLRETLMFTGHAPGSNSFSSARRAYDYLLQHQLWTMKDDPKNRKMKLVSITEKGRQYLDEIYGILSLN